MRGLAPFAVVVVTRLSIDDEFLDDGLSQPKVGDIGVDIRYMEMRYSS